ncbi:MAG: phosphopyruvate hydratase [Candidatus Thorarchaeota archaeon]|nr:MAG: phosphopyruvate hydratase [Candidatus Thorarchaeota archaeon]
MVKVSKIHAIEILDSRGNPTLMTKVTLDDGTAGVAKVPSGASTGIHEAVELRDGGDRYNGKGVLNAVNNVNTTLANVMQSVDPLSQSAVDRALLEADPSKGKGTLGANAILSVSMATTVAAARHLKTELFQYLRTQVIGKDEKYLLPVPLSNVINGGAHAGNSLAIQEFKILPVGVESFPESLRCISEVYHALGKRMIKKYGRMSKHIGDEGGFCGFGLKSTRDAFDEIIGAVEEAGYRPKTDVVLGIDAAASGFYKDGKYAIDGKTIDAGELLDFYISLEKDYPLLSVEDPFDEEAFKEFAEYTKKTKVQVITDDLTVSNPEIVRRAIDEKAGNALLLKVNQIGSVTEAIEAANIANRAGWAVVVSHRSGETGDTFISDLSVALSNGQIKTGAPARSDRVEKYNRLLEIYDILDGECGYPGSDFRGAWGNY